MGERYLKRPYSNSICLLNQSKCERERNKTKKQTPFPQWWLSHEDCHEPQCLHRLQVNRRKFHDPGWHWAILRAYRICFWWVAQICGLLKPNAKKETTKNPGLARRVKLQPFKSFELILNLHIFMHKL